MNPDSPLANWLRFYHGTGSTFDSPDPDRFDANGLFGPGYYLTSDPRVASSYADKRATDEGQNVRPVDVPPDLKLLDADSSDVGGLIQAIRDHLAQHDDFGHDRFWPEDSDGPVTGQTVWRSLARALGEGSYTAKTEANDLLALIGYDGVKYAGGKRVPLRDGAGVPIEHDAINVFPDALGKIINGLSGQPGGFLATDTPDGRVQSDPRTDPFPTTILDQFPGIGKVGPIGFPTTPRLPTTIGDVFGGGPDQTVVRDEFDDQGLGGLVQAWLRLLQPR